MLSSMNQPGHSGVQRARGCVCLQMDGLTRSQRFMSLILFALVPAAGALCTGGALYAAIVVRHIARRE